MANILAIDDDQEALLFVTGVLGKEHAVTTADNWMKASDLLVQHSYDLILLDIDMPVLSGDKLAEILQRRFADTPMNIVLFSGLEDGDVQKKAAEIRAKGYIHKPCPPDLFSLRVRRFLQ